GAARRRARPQARAPRPPPQGAALPGTHREPRRSRRPAALPRVAVGSSRAAPCRSLVEWTLAEVESVARGKLSQLAFDYAQGGAGLERTLAENVAAFGRYRFRPRYLV